MKHAKILAIATVAVFCISAFAFVVSIDDESSAASKVSYDIYLQLNDGTSSYSKWLPTVSVTGTVSQAALSEAVNTACTNAGITAEYSAGWATSFTVDGHKYTGKGTWSEKKDYWNFAQYYLKNDNTWGEISSYEEGTTVAIVLDEYQFSEPADKDKYYENPYGYWTVLPSVEMVEYNIYLQLNDGTSSYSKWLPAISEPNISKDSLSKAVNAACEKEGITAEYSAGWATSFTVDGHKYTGKGTWSEKKDYWNFAQYYGDGDAWKEVQTYNEAATVAIVLDEYQFSEPADKDKYYENPYGYWTVLPTVSPGDFDKKDDNNTMLYVGIGVGVAAVVVIAAVALVFLRKK